MSRPTSNPEVPGWYFTFLTAVVQQLPRPGNGPGRIDQTTAEGWAKNQMALKKAFADSLLPAVEKAVEIPVRATKFITRGHFIVDTSPEAKVKISGLSSNFQDWHLGTVEEKRPSAKLASLILKTEMVDRDIITELGGVTKVITWLQDIDRLLKKQPKGPNSKPGRLLTNGWANIFYVPKPVKKLDRNRFSFINSAGQEEFGGVADSQYLFELNGEWYVLRAVRVRWGGGGWHVGADSVEYPYEWSAWSQVFSRKTP